LTLTGAILAAGGFEDIGPRGPGDLVYVRVTGGRVPGLETQPLSGDVAAVIEAALEGLKRKVFAFDNVEEPYRSWTAPQFIGRQGGDYDHLARLWEWYVVGDGEAEAP
jgi:ATP-dependent helicase/nuclease subunit B